MALPAVFHPLILFFFSNFLVTITAGYTSQGSPLRYVALGILFVVSNITPIAVSRFTKTTGFAGRFLGGSGLWNCVTVFDRLILRSWDYHHYGPPSEGAKPSRAESKGDDTPKRDAQFAGSRMDFGSEVSGLARGIGRFWQVKNVSNFSEENLALVPTLGAFVSVQMTALVLCRFINNWTVAYCFNQDPRLLSNKHVPLLTRLPDVTAVELKTRTVISIGYWVVQYSNLQFLYSLCAVIGAISNPNDIWLWSPIFGNPKDAYTLRGFWGKSWHQNLRSGLEGISNFVADDVLHMPSKGILQRYTKIFTSFALSGIMHVYSDMGGGVTMRQSGAMEYFCMQALGIMIEDGVTEIYARFTSRTGRLPGFIEKAFGYVWVLFFFVWTSPVWVFPVTLQMKEEEAMLNLSALKPLLRWKSG